MRNHTAAPHQSARISNGFGVVIAPSPTKRPQTPLKDVLASKGISQARLAVMASVPEGTISHYVNGRKAKVGVKTRRKIEAALLDIGAIEARSPILVLDPPRRANIRFDEEAI